MKYYFCLILIFFMHIVSPAQDMEKIALIEILDCNLFISADSQLVKMAYVECPSIHIEKSPLAKNIIKFAKMEIKDKSLWFETVYRHADTIFIHLHRKYLLNMESINDMYLSKGYGKYFQPEGVPENIDYLIISRKARNKFLGLWKKEYPDFQPDALLFSTIGIHYSDNMNQNMNDWPTRVWILAYERHKQKSKYKLSAFIHKQNYYGEESGTSMGIGLVPRYYFRLKYLEFNIGLLMFMGGSEIIFAFGSPVFGLKIPINDRLYLRADYFDEKLSSDMVIGINYEFNRPYGEFCAGFSHTVIFNDSHSSWNPYAGVRFNLGKILLLDFQCKYDFKDRYGNLISGVGLIF